MKMCRKKIYKKNTINLFMFVVFFCVIIIAVFLFKNYSKNVTENAVLVIQEKIDKIIYQFFTDLITDDVINMENAGNLLEINKNSKEEIVSVDYNLEKTYKILTDISIILKNTLNNLENGNIDVSVYDRYLKNGKYGLILNVPFFIGSRNVFLNNLGPMIPVQINFNGTLLTNIKTKVTNYGFNNALLEIYVIVEMEKLIITPVVKDKDKFYYDILIGAVVINGSVPNFYGEIYESSSNILDIPMS